jgi:hypothetical protein
VVTVDLCESLAEALLPFRNTIRYVLVPQYWDVILLTYPLLKTCVRRRAILSVRANPACPDEAAAERAVNEVWESCFNDTRPFDEVRVKIEYIDLD